MEKRSVLKWGIAFAFVGAVYLADIAAISDDVRTDVVPSDGSGIVVSVSEQGFIGEPLDLNTASLEQLMELPHIGEAKAAAIIQHRERYGDFVTIEELKEVDGIGDGILAELRPYIAVE